MNKRRKTRHRGLVYHFVVALWRTKTGPIRSVKRWEIIADNRSKAGWSWGCILSSPKINS